jgi:hypothetical protein
VVGAGNEPDVASVPPGTRVTVDGDTALTRVFRKGSPARVDSYEQILGEVAARLRALGCARQWPLRSCCRTGFGALSRRLQPTRIRCRRAPRSGLVISPSWRTRWG